jgi:hypothetical protein
VSPFDWINQILVYRKPWESFSEAEQKSFSSYMVNRILSMDMEFLDIVNLFQKYAIGTLERREVYKWYCAVLPTGKRYNKYIKRKNENKYPKWLVELLTKHYELGSNDVIDYLDILYKTIDGKCVLKDILIRYGTDSKKIKTLKLENK